MCSFITFTNCYLFSSYSRISKIHSTQPRTLSSNDLATRLRSATIFHTNPGLTKSTSDIPKEEDEYAPLAAPRGRSKTIQSSPSFPNVSSYEDPPPILPPKSDFSLHRKSLSPTKEKDLKRISSSQGSSRKKEKDQKPNSLQTSNQSTVWAKCYKCKQDILSDPINTLDRYYHNKCFTCNHCDIWMGSIPFYYLKGELYCSNCHLSLQYYLYISSVK